MLLRIVYESVRRGAGRRVAVFAALLLASAIITALGTLSTEVGDRMARELRSYGANLVMLPAAQLDSGPLGPQKGAPPELLIDAGLLSRLKGIFWAHNVLAVVPYLEFEGLLDENFSVSVIGTWFEADMITPNGEAFTTGLKRLAAGWQVYGSWPRDAANEEAMAGIDVAQAVGLQVGDWFALRRPPDGEPRRFKITAIVSTGGREDRSLLVPLAAAEQLSGHRGKVNSVEISALVKPEDSLSRKDPRSMTSAEYDKWYCSPYISSIAYQIREAIPGVEVRAIRRVAEAEGRLLRRLRAVMLLIAASSLLAAGLVAASATAASLLERRAEIGLMKAIGASDLAVASAFLLEALIIGLIGGASGYLIGSLLAQPLALGTIGSTVAVKPLLLLPAVALTSFVALLGSALPLRAILEIRPAEALKP